MLEKFVLAKQPEIEALKRQATTGLLPAPYSKIRPDYAQALQSSRGGAPLALISEYKQASPSAGVICDTLTVENVVQQYNTAGADCISILTEERYFQGDLHFIERAARQCSALGQALPLLRKDFIFDPLQVAATAATPASALLLIVRLTPDVQLLRALREQAESFGLSCVVEIFDLEDLRLARASGAKIIQVNARDLQTFTVNREACLALAQHNPPEKHELWIAASGISQGEHLLEARDAGYSAVLVGSALMRGGHPGQALRMMLNSAKNLQEQSHVG